MQEQIDELNRKLDRILAIYERENWVDRMVLYRALQLKDKNQLTVLDSGTDGIKVGATSGKVGFYGVTPVIKAGAITSPAGGGSGSTDAIDISARTAIGQIKTALQNLGLTA